MIRGVVESVKESGKGEDEVYDEEIVKDTTGNPFMVKVVSRNHDEELQIPGEMTLLSVLEEAGLEGNSSCEVGFCGTFG